MNKNLLIDRQGRLQRMTLCRPEKRNALNVALCQEIVRAIRDAGDDSSVGAILLDAQGQDFCSGLDLAEVLQADQEVLLPLHTELFSLGTMLCKPLVAAVHGSALAGGLGLALNAHLILAASDARFGLTETKIGLWPYVIFPLVVDAVGKRKALALSLTARIFGAAEAKEIGIVDEVVPPAELAGKALRLANGLAAGSAAAISDGLLYVRRLQGLNDEGKRRLAVEHRRTSFASADFREGVAAFREKRTPVWPSHGSRA